MAAPVIGIDLGTINSCVAVVRTGRAVVLGEGSDKTIPSCLSFHGGREVVGHGARRHAVTDPASTVSAVKRVLGHAFDSAEVTAARERAAYPIRPSPLGSVILEVGGLELTPVQVSARVLQRVREVAEEALGQSLQRAVISVPAHFNDVQRKATKLAAEYAGLEVIRLINEPTAAAFAYGYRKGEDFALAVYDLGGGTFDITVMMARGDRFEVVATDGDSYLGGEDFDDAIAGWLRAEFETEHGHSLKDDAAALQRLAEAAERAKVELSEVAEAQIELPFLTQLPDGTRPNFARALDRARLEQITRPLVDRTLQLCERCIRESGFPTSGIDEVLLVGGQSRMPIVREAVREFFGKEPRRDINPDEVVALGAALYAYSLSADDLQQEAEGAAEEAFDVALKDAHVARKVVDEVRRLDTGALDLPELRERIQRLLQLAGENLPAHTELPDRQAQGEPAPAPPVELRERQAPAPEAAVASARPEPLPSALQDLRSEIDDLSSAASQAIARLAAGIREGAVEPEDEQGEPEILEFDELGRLSERLSNRIDSAKQASEAAQGHLEEADQHGRARRVDLVDVTSLALGISSAGDLFSVLIEQNTPVPVDKTRVFTTNQDGQSEVHVQVRQGRAKKASANQLLGDFVLEGIPPAPRMEPKVDVAFRIDVDGILSVSARDAESGTAQSIRVDDPLGLQQARREDIEKAEAEAAEAAAESESDDSGGRGWLEP